MNQEIIVNSTSHETRIALLENSQLSEVYVERNFDRGIVGNIYKGRVTRVLPGMQSAFVDIGFERDAFLYVGDISENLLTVEDFLEEEEGVEGEMPEETEGDSIPTDTLHIEDLLQEGQQILVQVAKEPIGSKGPRITAHISLPGRYIVFMPTINHIGISRKIEDAEEKERLKAIISSLKTGSRGYIVRTAGEGMEKEDFVQDINFLQKLWKEIVQRTEAVSAPSLIHEELGLIHKIVRDTFCEETSLMLVDSETAFQKALQFIDKIDHRWASRIKLYTKKKPIFDEYEVESQLEAALNSKVWLKSGGYIVINQTEALVAIDVNTGRYIGKRSLEETVFKTNMEAIREIVRQIRLRNLGGIIVIDFIDMEESEHRKSVLAELTELLKTDRSRSNILTIDEIGLVALTRKRSKQSLERFLTEMCPYCQGSGRIKSISTMALQIQREIMTRLTPQFDRNITVRVNPYVGEFLKRDEYDVLGELTRIFNIRIKVSEDPNLHIEEYNVVIN